MLPRGSVQRVDHEQREVETLEVRIAEIFLGHPSEQAALVGQVEDAVG
jgi:hypothetical protein